jgi:hypothetical protein
MIIPYNTCNLSNEDWLKGKPQANLKHASADGIQHILEQMPQQSKKNIHPHQQHTVKKNSISTPMYRERERTKLPPKTQNPTGQYDRSRQIP